MIKNILHNNLLQSAVKFVVMWAVVHWFLNILFPEIFLYYQVLITFCFLLYFLYKKQPIKIRFTRLVVSMVAAILYWPCLLSVVIIFLPNNLLTPDSKMIMGVVFYTFLFTPTFMYLLAFINEKAFKFISAIIIAISILGSPILLMMGVISYHYKHNNDQDG